MKIAISFFGQPRFYKEAILQWKPLINKLNADVFIHTWWGEDMVGDVYPCAPHIGFRRYDKLVHKDIINDLKKLYKPKSIEWDSYKTFNLPDWAKPNTPDEHATFQFYTQYRSKELVKQSGIEYDVVIRTRIDAIIGFELPLDVSPNVIYVGAPGGQLGAPNDNLTISDLNTFFKLSDTYLNLKKFSPNVKEYAMERYLGQQLKHENISWEEIEGVNETNFNLLRVNARDRALGLVTQIEENVSTCCAITMEPDEVLELIDKLKETIKKIQVDY